MENWEKSILHASEFSQMTLTVVKNIVDKEVINVNNIHFDQLCNEQSIEPKSQLRMKS